MSPVELIQMIFFGSILVIVLAIVWFIFRKKKKIALTVTIFSVVVFILFFALRPYYIQQQHAERYEILVDYLHKQYSKYEFDISPKILEEGDTPYEYRVVANNYKYRNEYYRVDQNGVVMFSHYSTMVDGNEEELDYLLLNSVYEKPFEYIERSVELKEIVRYEEDSFLLRLMSVEGELILYNYLKKRDGQFFLEKSRLPNENNYIEMNVSPNHYTNYYVLATLPGFMEEQWRKENGEAAKVEIKGETPAIYVVPN